MECGRHCSLQLINQCGVCSVECATITVPYKGSVIDTSMVFNQFQEIEQDNVIILSKTTLYTLTNFVVVKVFLEYC